MKKTIQGSEKRQTCSGKVKVRKNKREGVLKGKGVIIYQYRVDGHVCNFRKIKEDGSFSK